MKNECVWKPVIFIALVFCGTQVSSSKGLGDLLGMFHRKLFVVALPSNCVYHTNKRYSMPSVLDASLSRTVLFRIDGFETMKYSNVRRFVHALQQFSVEGGQDSKLAVLYAVSKPKDSDQQCR